jgi:leucine dehydrogenase
MHGNDTRSSPAMPLPTRSSTTIGASYVSPRLSVYVVMSSGGAVPANGGLRLLPYRSDRACRADGHRLAGLMETKHRLYGTGFAGGKVVARASDPAAVKQELLHATGLMLEALHGTMLTGCDLNTGRADMEQLARLTPHVLAAVGSGVDPSACTAHGTVGALLAVHPRPGRALVHGCGAVGGVVARELVARGWQVFCVDQDPARAAIPGTRALDPHGPWLDTAVDVLLPCSISGLLGVAQARRIEASAVVPAANAPFRSPEALAVLERRGVAVLPDPLVNAGAVIADSIERYVPQAWAAADPARVYRFVAQQVRQRCRGYLAQRALGSSRAEALAAVTAAAGGVPIGHRFAL